MWVFSEVALGMLASICKDNARFLLSRVPACPYGAIPRARATETKNKNVARAAAGVNRRGAPGSLGVCVSAYFSQDAPSRPLPIKGKVAEAESLGHQASLSADWLHRSAYAPPGALT